ncbi:MAG TPA: hypothetical protein VLU25_06160 [Acidobacteriota bacterium]|nr:hypothetical protein [Acidobacteriota bacterium]
MGQSNFGTLTAPQVVNNNAVTTQIVLLNTASTACGVSITAHEGAGQPPLNPVDLGGAQPNLLEIEVPAEGSASFNVSSPQGFLGAISAEILNPGCAGNLQMQAQYLIANQTPLDELFSYSTPSSIPVDSCAVVPVSFDPDTQDGDSVIPGLASAFFGQGGLQLDICHELRDQQGQVVQPNACSPYDGSHQSQLLAEIFPNQGSFDGTWRVCYFNAGSTMVNADTVIDTLFIDVVQIGNRFQFDSNQHEQVKPNCIPGPRSICLSDRFRVSVDFQETPTGPSQPADGVFRDDSGYFFFNPDNVELIVKVLDGCDINDRFWVFYAATTNVEYTITVTDTQSNSVFTAENPFNTPFDPITDTQAFATCP